MNLTKREQDEDQQAFLPKTNGDVSLLEEGPRKPTSAFNSYLRLGLEIVMAFVIVVLFIRPFSDRKAVKPSPVPSCMIFHLFLKF
jgi:hypothetical protein